MSHYIANQIPILQHDDLPQWAHLRTYQQHAINAVRLAYTERHVAPLLVMPAGSGKTFTACYSILRAVQRGRKVLVLVHRRELAGQFSAALTAYGVRHELLLAGAKHAPREQVVVASVQTYARRLGRFAWYPQIIVCDEAHHVVPRSLFARVLNYHRGALRLGLTATPVRLDGQGLGVQAGGFFDAMVEGPQPMELIEAGALSPYRLFEPQAGLGVDMSGCRSAAGDFVRSAAEERINRPTITGDAIGHYGRLANGGKAVVFCMTRRHAEDVSRSFCEAGYRFAVLDGTLDDQLRAQRIADLEAGALQGLVTVDLVSEGFDLPAIAVAISLRATQSEALWIQQMARALRPAPGKDHAILLDHVGNRSRHGFPDDERAWSLEGRPRKKRTADEQAQPIKQCDACGFVHRPGPSQCPNCGNPYPVRQREVDMADGELHEADREAVRAERGREIAQAKSYQDFLWLAQKYGYKPGWAHRQWQLRTARGQGQYRRAAPPLPPIEAYQDTRS